MRVPEIVQQAQVPWHTTQEEAFREEVVAKLARPETIGREWEHALVSALAV